MKTYRWRRRWSTRTLASLVFLLQCSPCNTQQDPQNLVMYVHARTTVMDTSNNKPSSRCADGSDKCAPTPAAPAATTPMDQERKMETEKVGNVERTVITEVRPAKKKEEQDGNGNKEKSAEAAGGGGGEKEGADEKKGGTDEEATRDAGNATEPQLEETVIVLEKVDTSQADHQEERNANLAGVHDPHPCTCPEAPPEYTQHDPPLAGSGGRIGYLITVHNFRTIEDATHLFRRIRYPKNIILIHLDAKCEWSTYLQSSLRKEVENCACGSEVRVASLFESTWGAWTMNKPTHWGMEHLALDDSLSNKWDVFINLSGDSFPVLTAPVLSRLFDPQTGPLAGYNFVTANHSPTGLRPTAVHEYPTQHGKRFVYTNSDWDKPFDWNIPHVPYGDKSGVQRNMTIVPYFGSQWMMLTREFVHYVASSFYAEGTLPGNLRIVLTQVGLPMTDETFLPTVLMNSPFKSTVPQTSSHYGGMEGVPWLKAVRYERIDEHRRSLITVNSLRPRYDVSNESVATKTNDWGPYFLGVYDLADISRYGALFIRKVSQYVDHNMLHLLPVSNHSELPFIDWPQDIEFAAPTMAAEE